MQLLLLLLPSLAAAAGADCPARAGTAELADTLDQAEAAWRSADEAGFFERMEELQLLLPCLDEPLDAPLAARAHRNTGLWLYATGHPARAEAAFASARRSSPGEALPAELVPAAHPARALFEAARPGGEAKAVPAPANGQLLFDGQLRDRPAGGPTYAQLQITGGGIAWTTRLATGEPLPPYELAPPEPEPPLAVAEAGVSLPTEPVTTAASSRRGRLGLPLALGAGALGLGGGALGLVARSSQARFLDDPPTDRDGLDALYSRNRAASTASAILLGSAGAVGVAAVVAW